MYDSVGLLIRISSPWISYDVLAWIQNNRTDKFVAVNLALLSRVMLSSITYVSELKIFRGYELYQNDYFEWYHCLKHQKCVMDILLWAKAQKRT